MSAIRKTPKITYEWDDKVYVLEADRGLEFSIEGNEVKLVARSSRHFDIKPKPEPEKPKARTITHTNIELYGKSYVLKLEEVEEKKPAYGLGGLIQPLGISLDYTIKPHDK